MAHDPMQSSYPTALAAVSSKQFLITGIVVTVYGLEELDAVHKNVACLWLLHARGGSQEKMTPVASTAIRSWNSRLEKRQTKDKLLAPGLIAVTLDQRNHGSRLVQSMANEAWRGGNELHAQDMFSVYHGTALDTSQIITFLSSYVFPKSEHKLVDHLVMGVSLGGHCAWHCILHDHRISTAVVVIGCPDYSSLMYDRARLSKLKSWTESDPPGATFIGSPDFPSGLVEAVERYDPAGFFLGNYSKRTDASYGSPNEEEKRRLIPLLNRTLRGKRIYCLSGGEDKLVPYSRSAPFLKWLKEAIGPDGWYKDGGVVLEDLVFAGAGHEMTPAMAKEAVDFVCDSLEASIASIGRRRMSLSNL